MYAFVYSGLLYFLIQLALRLHRGSVTVAHIATSMFHTIATTVHEEDVASHLGAATAHG